MIGEEPDQEMIDSFSFPVSSNEKDFVFDKRNISFDDLNINVRFLRWNNWPRYDGDVTNEKYYSENLLLHFSQINEKSIHNGEMYILDTEEKDPDTIQKMAPEQYIADPDNSTDFIKGIDSYGKINRDNMVNRLYLGDNKVWLAILLQR